MKEFIKLDDIALKSEHFFVPVNGMIYEAAQKLINNGQVADSITLNQYFEKDPALIEIDGTNYLVKLSEASAIAPNSDHYAKLIYDLSNYKNSINQSNLIKLHFYPFGGIKKTSDWLNSLKKSDFIYNANNEFEILKD